MAKFELPKLASRVRFPSPAPRKVPERGLFTWSGSRGKNPRRKLSLTWRGFGCGCILYSTPAKRLSRTPQAPRSGRRSLTAGFSLHPLHTVKKDGFSAIFFYRKLTKQSSLTAGFQVHLNFRCNSIHFYSGFRLFSSIPL